MNLAEIFRSTLGEKRGHESIIFALTKVNHLFSEMLMPDTGEEECIRFFFDKGDALCPNENYYNIMECWREMEPFIWNYPSIELHKFWLLQMIQEQEAVKQVMQYNKILDMETEKHVESLLKLAESIEDIFHKKYMIEIRKEKREHTVWAVYSLQLFDKQLYHSYRDFLMQKLYYLLRNKGKIVVVAGSKGFTPQCFFEYNMCDFKYSIRKISPAPVCDSYLEENKIAIRCGLMNGYVYDELW